MLCASNQLCIWQSFLESVSFFFSYSNQWTTSSWMIPSYIFTNFTKLHTILHSINFVFVRVFVLQSMNHIDPPERSLHGETCIYIYIYIYRLYQTAYHPLVMSSLHFEGSVLIVSSRATMYEQSMNHIFLNNFAVTSWHIQVYKITNCTDLAVHNKLAHIRIVTNCTGCISAYTRHMGWPGHNMLPSTSSY